MESRFLFVCLLFVFAAAATATAVRDLGGVGGWTPIENVNDAQVVEIGKFAVEEHNKQAKADLKFDSVVKGSSQVVAGVNYRLVMAANDGAEKKLYEAVVWEKPWLNYRNLTSFAPYKE